VGICNLDTTTWLDTNVNFCSREDGSDGVIVGQYKMKGCQSNSPAAAKADNEILKMLFREGKSYSFGDGILQRFGLDLFGFKNEPPRWNKTKMLLCFAMGMRCLRENILAVQNQWHIRMEMVYKECLLLGAPETLIVWYSDINSIKGPMGPTFDMFEQNW